MPSSSSTQKMMIRTEHEALIALYHLGNQTHLATNTVKWNSLKALNLQKHWFFYREVVEKMSHSQQCMHGCWSFCGKERGFMYFFCFSFYHQQIYNNFSFYYALFCLRSDYRQGWQCWIKRGVPPPSIVQVSSFWWVLCLLVLHFL